MPTLIAPDPQRRLQTLQRFPVSILLTLQLAVTVIVPALLKGTEPLGTILAICTTAIVVSLCFEALASPIVQFKNQVRTIRLKPARWVWGIGIAAIAVSTLGGQGSYAVQLGLASQSPLVSLFTPFVPWALFGAVLHMWFYVQGVITRRQAMWAVGTVIAAHAAAGLYRAILGQAAAAIVTLLVVAVLMGLVRLRALAGIIAALVIVWPTVYDFRDSARKDVTGSSSVVSAEDPMGRLQLDEQMSLVGRFKPGGGQIDVPTATTVIRTGLLPSVIDSPRPPLDTGSQMSVALGGSYLNSRSATFFGNVYIFEGMTGIGVVAAALALAMGVAMRRSRSPWWFMVAALIYQAGMSFNATYPNGIVSFLQGLQALVFAYAFVHLWSRRPHLKRHQRTRRAARSRSMSRRGPSVPRGADPLPSPGVGEAYLPAPTAPVKTPG